MRILSVLVPTKTVQRTMNSRVGLVHMEALSAVCYCCSILCSSRTHSQYTVR